MTDIARLGFDIDTQPLARANSELRSLVASARQAQRAADSLATSTARVGAAAAANVNAASVAFRNVANGATNAAAQMAAAHRTVGTAANASVAAVNAGSAAAGRAAAAQTAAAAAAGRAAAAQTVLAANTNVAAAATARSNGIFNTFNNTITGSVGGISRLAAGVSVLAAALTASAFAKAADNFTNLQNAMKMAGLQGDSLLEVQNRLFDAANKNGVPVEALTTLYRRGSIAAAELGKSQNDLLKVVDVVAASLRIQGTSVEAARGALLQLGQSFGTGVVHAEEYNSLLENAYPLLQAAARGMKGMDGSVANLTNAVKNGKVSSKEFFDAIIKGGKDTIAMAGSINLTLGGAWQTVVNGFTEFVGKVGDGTGATKGLTSAIESLGRGLKDLANDKQFLEDINTLFATVTSTIQGAVSVVAGLIGLLKDGLAMAREVGREANAARTLQGGSIVRDEKGRLGTSWGIDKYNDEINALDARIISEKNKYDISHRAMKGPYRTEELQKQFDLIQAMRQERDKLYGQRSGLLSTATSQMLGDPDAAPKVDPQLKDVVYGPWPGSPKLDEKGKATDILGKKNKGTEDSYRKLIQAAKNYIELEEDKTRALSMSVEQGQIFVHQQELYNKALMAGLPLTQKLKDELDGLAKKMASADNAHKAAKFTQDAVKQSTEFVAAQQAERDSLTMSAEAAMAYRIEKELIAKATADGIKLKPAEIQALKDSAAATAAAAIETQNYAEMMGTLKEFGKGALEGIMQALVKGTSVWDAFANAATRALDRIISKISDVAIDELFGLFNDKPGASSSSASSSGGIFGAVKNLFNFGGSSSTGGGFFSNIGGSLGNMWDQTTSFFGLGDSMFNAGQAGSAFLGPAAPASGLFGSGISSMGALGALGGGIGGIMQMMRGGTGNMIGGIGSMIGAGVSLIPGIGQIAGPIISILSSVLPSLLGGEDKREHSYMNSSIAYGPKGYYSSGGAWGSGVNSTESEKALMGIGGSIQSIYDMLGGVKDPSKVWGMNASSWTASGKDWSYTSNATHLVDPKGNQTAWRMNEENMMDTGGAQVAIHSILEGAMGEVSAAMKTALTTLKDGIATTLQEVADSVTFVKDVYDELGKPALETKAALKALDAQFDAVRKTAEKLGLAVKPVDDALAQSRKDTAKAFMHDINMYFDPVGTGMADLASAAEKARLEIQYLISEGLANASDLNKVNNYYVEQETALRERLYGVTLDSIRDVITRLTTGDLSGATQTTQYSAAYSSFFKTIDEALKGDTDASGRALDEAVNLANLGKGQYGSSGGFQNLKQEIAQALARLETMVGTKPGAPTGGTGTNTPDTYTTEYVQSLIAQLAASQQAQMTQTTQINTLVAKLTQLIDLQQRVATNM